MDGLEEDAAQHGTSLTALIPMLVDEGAEVGHGGAQVLVQLEICRDLHCHLISLQNTPVLFRGLKARITPDSKWP